MIKKWPEESVIITDDGKKEKINLHQKCKWHSDKIILHQAYGSRKSDHIQTKIIEFFSEKKKKKDEECIYVFCLKCKKIYKYLKKIL